MFGVAAAPGLDELRRAAEVGIRLMQPEGYRELGLSCDQARTLASEYMQRLDKEYGHAAVAEIASRIFEASR